MYWGEGYVLLQFRNGLFVILLYLSAHTRVKSKFCLTCSQRTNTKITSDSQTTLFFLAHQKNLSIFQILNKVFVLLKKEYWTWFYYPTLWEHKWRKCCSRIWCIQFIILWMLPFASRDDPANIYTISLRSEAAWLFFAQLDLACWHGFCPIGLPRCLASGHFEAMFLFW